MISQFIKISESKTSDKHTWPLGLSEGCIDGLSLGLTDGCNEGRSLGRTDGCNEGISEGCIDGAADAM